MGSGPALSQLVGTKDCRSNRGLPASPGAKYPNEIDLYAVQTPGHSNEEPRICAGSKNSKEAVTEDELQKVKTRAKAN